MKQLARYCLLAAMLALIAAPATAKPRSIGDCDKIQDGDAYNRCLASFGPKRGASRPGKAYSAPSRTNRKYGRRRMRSGNIDGIRIYRSGGRVRTVIPVGRRKQR